MKYLCLVYQDEQKLGALSPGELDALVADSLAWLEDLEQSGRHLFSIGLQCACTAATLRSRGGHLTILEGSGSGAREALGGVILLQARDLNDAIQVAAAHPAARFGSLEVRPVLDPDQPLPEALDRALGAALHRAGSA